MSDTNKLTQEEDSDIINYPSDIELERNIPLKENQYLFHYTTYSAALGILLSQQMRLGALANMNDPLEFENLYKKPVVFDGNPSFEQLCELTDEHKKAVMERQNFVRFVSFSMDLPKGRQGEFYNNLSKGWARSRMWAQYADNHKGVCLVFDRKNVIKAFKNEFDSNQCETYCREVKYTNDLSPIEENLCRPFKTLLESDKINFLFQKCEDFRDEQEFRLLLVNKELNDDKEIQSFSISSSICGVIPGVKFPKEDEVTLRRAIETSNPKIRWLPIWWSCGMPRLSDYIRLKKMIDEIGISE